MSDGGGGPEDNKLGEASSPGFPLLIGEPGDVSADRTADGGGGGGWSAGAGGVTSACAGGKRRSGTGDFFFSGLAEGGVDNGSRAACAGGATVVKD